MPAIPSGAGTATTSRLGGTSWHIVALNSECAAGLRVQVGWEGDCAAGSEQEQWLRADLAANTSDCTLAYWHHPRFSSGDIGDNPIMAPIWNALYEDHADIVLAGHDHNYERLAQAGPTGAREPGRGIRSWVVGTGGKNLKPIPSALPASDVRDNTSHGVLQLTLHGAVPAHPRGWYEWEFAGDGRSASTFTDSGAGDCVGPPVQPTPDARATTTTTPRPPRHRRWAAVGRCGGPHPAGDLARAAQPLALPRGQRAPRRSARSPAARPSRTRCPSQSPPCFGSTGA